MPRKLWSQLSPATKKRKLGYYKKHRGLSPSQVVSRYNNGTLGSQAGTRGHAHTPEHGLREAQKSKNPDRYRDYIRKRATPEAKPVSGSAEDEAYELNGARDAAYYNMTGKLRGLPKYHEATVRANVYGGETSESGDVPGMTLGEARWSANASQEELRVYATPQYLKNPWFYH